MKIELVGGSRCGEIVNVKYVDPLVMLTDWEGKEVSYSRRDRPFTLSEKHGGCYGEKGHRMYDKVRESVPTE